MAKRVDPLKAKQARQKKIAIAGGVLLLALLGVQGPKTLKMLQGPQPVASSASTVPATTTGTTPAPTSTTGLTPTPAPTGAELTAVADSDQAPTIEAGQLATFERFESKDPFVQQAEPKPTAPPRTSKPNDGTKPKPSKETEEKPEGEEGGTGGFTTGGSTTAPPELAAATSISVNGVAEDVAVEGAFPKDEPTFVLVSVAKNGKSVELGIAGGEYAGGGETMTLSLGKKLTLQNTADGSRYELELLTIQGFPVPKPKK